MAAAVQTNSLGNKKKLTKPSEQEAAPSGSEGLFPPPSLIPPSLPYSLRRPSMRIQLRCVDLSRSRKTNGSSNEYGIVP